MLSFIINDLFNNYFDLFMQRPDVIFNGIHGAFTILQHNPPLAHQQSDCKASLEITV